LGSQRKVEEVYGRNHITDVTNQSSTRLLLAGKWTTNLTRMPSSTKSTKPAKLQEALSTSPSKIIYVEDIFKI
jgi:hypothetical protein